MSSSSQDITTSLFHDGPRPVADAESQPFLFSEIFDPLDSFYDTNELESSIPMLFADPAEISSHHVEIPKETPLLDDRIRDMPEQSQINLQEAGSRTTDTISISSPKSYSRISPSKFLGE